MKRILVFVALFSACCYSCGWAVEPPQPLSLGNLCQDADACDLTEKGIESLQARYANWNNSRVTIRGFLYQSQEGRWILASSPNLKTCCVGHASKAIKQVTVHGGTLAASPDRVIALSGTFIVEPAFNDQNALTGLFHLKDATMMPQDPRESFPWILLLGLLGTAGVFVFTVRRFRAGA